MSVSFHAGFAGFLELRIRGYVYLHTLVVHRGGRGALISKSEQRGKRELCVREQLKAGIVFESMHTVDI